MPAKKTAKGKTVSKKAAKSDKTKPTKKAAAAKGTTAKAKGSSRKTPARAAAKPATKSAAKRKSTAAAKPEPKIKARPAAGAKAPKRLSAAARKKFTTLLLDMRTRLMGQINSLQNDSLRRFDSVNSEEDGTDAYERQFALGLASADHETMFQIDEALRRLDQKTYGVCEDCGCLIEQPRLEAIPFVMNCIACQSEREKASGRHRRVMLG